MTWTQPLCVPCWSIRNPERIVDQAKFQQGDTERCCDCGEQTWSGIYTRIDPNTVPFPREEL